MGYVGNQQAEGFVQRPTKQDLTGATGNSLTLTHAVSKEEDIDLYINNVKQEPTTAYTVADTAVTLTGSVVASDDIYVVYNSLALQTVVPPDGSITNAKIDTMAASKLTGALPAIDGSSLTGMGKGHAFSARVGAAFAVSATTFTKVQFNTEDFDVDNEFDTTTYRFTPTVAGYYQLNASAAVASYVTQMQLAFYKNGAVDKNCVNVTGGGQVPASGLIYLNGSTDYVEVYVWLSGAQNVGAGFFDGFLARAS